MIKQQRKSTRRVFWVFAVSLLVSIGFFSFCLPIVLQLLTVKAQEPNGYWNNRYSHITDWGNGTYTMTTYMGPQVFNDSGVWAELKFVDNYAVKGFYLLQNAHVAVEIYDYYAKYYDPDYKTVSGHDERFEVQRWKVNKWDDLGAQSGTPTFTITHNTTFIAVRKSFTSWAGVLNISYILRPGAFLKHEITFKSVIAESTTFRVVMKLAGITSAKVMHSGGTETVTAEKSIGKQPWFMIGENSTNLALTEYLWSLGVVNEAGVWNHEYP